MASPRADHSPKKHEGMNGGMNGGGSADGEVRMPGYFDVVSETDEE